MTHGSLFSGIGGFDLAAEWAGWENVFHCEYEPFAQKVLKHHFPNSKLYNDIRTFDATDYFGRIDILTGGFPCQPFSAAGKRKGTEDSRHLWPEMLRIIREVAPKYVVGENVRGIINWSGGMVFEQVCADLEAEGYEVQPYLLPACGKNAPHRRDRIWFIAFKENATNTDKCRNTQQRKSSQSKRKSDDFKESKERFDYSQFNNEHTRFLQNATDTDSYGQQQEWRYDGGCKNAKGSKQKSVRSANSKNSDGRSTNGISEGQANIDRKTSKSELHQKNESTESNRISKLVKKPNLSKKTEQNDENKINDSRALVQKRQDGFQLSEHRRVVSSNENNDTTKGTSRKNDIPGVKRMEGNVTNTTNNRCRGGSGKRSEKERNGLLSGKQQGRTVGSETEGRSRERIAFKPGGWELFPTQSPICGRNDGLSQELDGITFSKWRKESIKAYGNAIVPQVAYEIFKAINKIENELLLR